MTSYLPFMTLTVMVLILTIGLWIGTILMRKARTGAAWWLMLSGLIAGTLGVLGYGIMMSMMVDSIQVGRAAGTYSPGSHSSTTTYAISGGVCGIVVFCAAILFNVGFVLNSLAIGRLAKRAAELEGICAAMGAELQQTRSLTGR